MVCDCVLLLIGQFTYNLVLDSVTVSYMYGQERLECLKLSRIINGDIVAMPRGEQEFGLLVHDST